MKFTTTFLRYTLLSPLSSRVIAAELNARICGPNEYRNEKVKPYSGVADDTSFAIRRVTKGKNNQMQKSFNFIKGTINPNGAGSSIDITMDIPLVIFVVFELVIVGSLVVFIINNASDLTFLYFVPILMLPLTFGLLFFIVKAEMNKSKAFLRELFKADEVSAS